MIRAGQLIFYKTVVLALFFTTSLCAQETATISNAGHIIQWNAPNASGWTLGENHHMSIKAIPNEIESITTLPKDFAIRFQIRFGHQSLPETPGTPSRPLEVRFRLKEKNSYSLYLDSAYRMALHANKNGQSDLIAGVPNPGPSGYLKPDIWYNLIIQALGDRISIKLWESAEPEPDVWNIDITDNKIDKGSLRLAGTPGVELGPVALENPQPVNSDLSTDLRPLRFKKRTWPVTDFQVIERADEIEIRGELCRMIFSRTGCSVAQAYIRGELFPVGHLPDIRYVVPGGTEYRQSYSKDGTLKSKGWKNNYYVLEGSCRPADKAGNPGLAAFDFRYRIHRELGIVLVDARCTKQTPVHRFEFVNCLEDKPEQGVDYLHCSGQWAKPFTFLADRWGVPRATLNQGPVARDNSVIIGEQLLFARWSSGQYGFEVQGMSYYGGEFSTKSTETKRVEVVSVQEGGIFHRDIPIGTTMLDELKTEKYLTVRSRHGKRSLDLVFINLDPSEPAVDIGLDHYSFGFQFLPFRKYHPNLWLNGYIPYFGFGVDMDSISALKNTALEAARMGIQATHIGVGDIRHTTLADTSAARQSLNWRRLKRCVDALHAGGLRGTPGWWGATWDCKEYISNGWMTADNVPSAVAVNYRLFPNTDGTRHGMYPHVLGGDFCYNDPKMRDVLVDGIIHGYIHQFGSDGVYIDGFYPWIPCQNQLHGCRYGDRQVEGFIDICERFRKLSDRSGLPLPPVLWGHSSENPYGPLGLSDFVWPGEMFVPPWVPNKSELEGYFSSLLHGYQAIYCADPGNGGPDCENARTYEGALSRCAFVQASSAVCNAWFAKKYDYIGLKLWQRCMLPLGIFDINNSGVHHPFDEDYGQYAKVPEKGATAILYHRPDDVLLVAVREADNPSETATVTLHASAIGLGESSVWCFDTAAQELKQYSVKNGWIDLGILDLSQGPRIFHLVRADKKPKVVWHNQIVWEINQKYNGKKLALATTGVPNSAGMIYVACDENGRPRVQNGQLANYDESNHLAAISLNFSDKAIGEIVLAW